MPASKPTRTRKATTPKAAPTPTTAANTPFEAVAKPAASTAEVRPSEPPKLEVARAAEPDAPTQPNRATSSAANRDRMSDVFYVFPALRSNRKQNL